MTTITENRQAAADPGAPPAERLAERLVALATRPGASGSPTEWPTDPTLLAWLRAHTNSALYTWAFEEMAARRWVGGDLYGTRVLPAPPPFLARTDTRHLPPALVAPLLRRLSLTRDAPTAQELTPDALARDPGPVTTVTRSPANRSWGQIGGRAPTPPLPDEVTIPHLLHGIWLGGPLPEGNTFWVNFAAAARRYAGRLDVVLWTDIPRTAVADPRHARLLAWAREHGIHVIDVHEVFSAAAPMILNTAYSLETTKHLPRGYAAASDHLRVDIVHRFGGIYADGDIGIEGGLEQLVHRVATSVLGFTLNFNQYGQPHPDVVIAPAGHPAIRLWLECARLNYYMGQPEMFGGVRVMALPYAGRPNQEHRYLVPHRSGRVHLFMLRLTRIPDWMLTPLSPAIRPGRAYSWLPSDGAPEPVATRTDPAGVLRVLTDCLTFLRWQILTRHGDLYLTAVDPVIRGLPDPDLAWTALLGALARLGDDLRAVTSVTDQRWNDDGTLSVVALPAAAEALLDRTAAPGTWIGAEHAPGREIWLLDERVTPVAWSRR